MSEDPTPYQHEERAPTDWTSGTRWRHLKTGRVYATVGRCRLEATGEPAVLYTCHEDGTVWARAMDEFLDGRFERVEAPSQSQDEVGAPAPCEVSHNDGKPLDTQTMADLLSVPGAEEIDLPLPSRGRAAPDTSGKSLGQIAFLEHHMRGFPPFTEEEAHLFWGELEERERQEWEAAAQAVRLHVLEEAAKEWRDAVQHFSVVINAVAMTSSSEELRSFITALPDTFPVPKSCVTDEEIRAATEEARRIRPEIERESPDV